MDYTIYGTNDTSRVLYYNLGLNKHGSRRTMRDAGFEDGFMGLTVEHKYIPEDKPEWLMDDEEVLSFNKKVLNPHSLVRGIYLPITSNRLRERIYNDAGGEMLLDPLTFVDSRAYVDTDDINRGTIILEGSTVQSGVKIGKACILWSSVHIGHGSTLKDFIWVTTHSTICGNVTLNNRVYVGANCVVEQNTVLAEDTVLLAGAIVSVNSEPGDVFGYGRNNKLSKKSHEMGF